jgi:hypothetical protein
MNIQIKHYDRVLLLELSGPVLEPDLVQIAGFVNTLITKVSAVVADVRRAELEMPVVNTLMRLKKQYEKAKIRFLVASPDLIGADAVSPEGAVKTLKSTEADRIAELFAADAELAQMQAEVAKARAQLVSALGLTETAEAPLAKDAISKAMVEVEERNKQLLQMFKTLSSEIHHLQGGDGKVEMPGSDNPTAVRVAETKRRALDQIRAGKVLD